MIGRDTPVKPFELIRWARAMACPISDRREYLTDPRCPDGLKPLHAQVLLILATYANRQAEAWPSIGQIARDSGRRPTAAGRHSAVSQALQDLGPAKYGVIWSTERGRGKSARRELLFDPAQVSRYGDIKPEGASGLVSPDWDTFDAVGVPDEGHQPVAPKRSDVPAEGPVMSRLRDTELPVGPVSSSPPPVVEKRKTDRPENDVPNGGHQDSSPVLDDLSDDASAFLKKLRARQAAA